MTVGFKDIGSSNVAIKGPSLSQYPGSPLTLASNEKGSKQKYVSEGDESSGVMLSTLTDWEKASSQIVYVNS